MLSPTQADAADPSKVKEAKVRVCNDCASFRPSVRFSLPPKLSLQQQQQQQQLLQHLAAAAGTAATPPTPATALDTRMLHAEDESGPAPRSAHSSSTTSKTGPPSPHSRDSQRSGSGLFGTDDVFEPGDDAVASHVEPLVCVAVHNFSNPEDPGEITIIDGDEVLVEEVEAGWATGTNQGTGAYGFFPAWAVVLADTREPLPDGYSDSLARAPSPDRRSSSTSNSQAKASPKHASSAPGTTPRGRTSPSLPAFEAADKRAKVMYEICTTERSYLHSLDTLLRLYVRPLSEDFKSGKPQIGGGVLGVVDESGNNAVAVFFSHLEHIFTLNTQLFAMLKVRLKAWDSATSIVGDVFESFAPLIKMYDEFSASYEFATKALVDREKADAKLRQFLAQTDAESTNPMSCLALLITPIQRVPRYLLLLSELLKVRVWGRAGGRAGGERARCTHAHGPS
jgi:hypothetical protein